MAVENDFFQIFVRLLDNKTLTLQFTNQSPITGDFVKQQIQSLAQIPSQFQKLTLNGRSIGEQTLISPKLNNSTIQLNLSLLGGKGGFGSLLRGAATKAGQKKTNNFDACRDMSGRRLRHVNAEKKIEEWMAEEQDRKLEKAAEDYLKKMAKTVKKKGGDVTDKYVQKYREESAKCVEDVERSVRESVGELLVGKKRKLMEQLKSKAGKEQLDSKKLKIWMGKRRMGESDSDDTDEDESDSDDAEKESSIVTDNGNHSDSSKELEGSSDTNSATLLDVACFGRSSESDPKEEKDLSGGSSESSDSPSGSEKDAFKPSSVGQDQQVPLNNSASQDIPELEATGCKSEVLTKTPNVSTDIPEVEDHPINLDDISSAAELEVFGLEKLKTELQAHGLKCGGTLQERAARLYLLKTTSIEKLPKKLFAKK